MGNPQLVSVDSDSLLFPASVLGALDKRNHLGAVGPSLSYRKRLVHNLVYQHPDAAAASSQFGASLYPQTFVIDTTANEILVISGPPQIVSVYNWTTGAYKGVVYSLGRSGVSESADIRYENGKRYLYTTDISGSTNGTLVKFDITSHPAKLTTASPVATYTVDVLNSIHWRNGHWVSASNTATSGSDGSYRSRGRLSFYDSNFVQYGMADIPSTVAGGSKQYQAASMPKLQGFDEGPGYFVFGVGGGWNPSVTMTPYHYGGVRVFTPTGDVIVDSLMRADAMIAILNANGCEATLVENEGVQIVDGKIYTVWPINSASDTGPASRGGIVILEEFSEASDAIDFSAAAASWTMPDVKRMQSGSHPLGSDGKLHNLVTWAPLNSLTDICVYMQAIGQDRFAFYSSDAPVTDSVGTAIPAGYYVEVLNRNQMSFVVTLTGNGTTRRLLLTYDGTNWSQSRYPDYVPFTPASPLQNVSSSTTNRYWIDGNNVYFQFAVAAASGQLPAGNNVILPTGGLPAKYRPDFTVNAAIIGHTSGSAMRFSADNTGLVQLVTVPASTHNYATGIVSWPATSIS